MYRLGGTFSLAAAINLITALIAILPDAVIGIISEVTRYLQKLKLNARVRGTGIHADAGADVWTSLRDSFHESGKAILSAGPFGDREVSGLGVVWCLAYVSTVLFAVQPLPGIGCGWQCAVEIFDLNLVAGIDGQASNARWILTELKLAGPDIFTETSLGVLVGIECQIVARSSLEEIAFTCILSVDP